MNELYFPHRSYRFAAIVELLGAGIAPSSQHVRLLYGDGYIEAHTWLLDPATALPPIPTAHVVVIETPEAEPRYVLAACQFDATIAPGDYLADRLCPIPGVVTQTKALIESIQFEPLRVMVFDALTRPGAARGYWTAPASLHDHHNYDGGLAHHSLEVATMVASSNGLLDEDRDAGIALALLHDYGKIWCYREGEYTPAQKRGHKRIGLDMLEPPLASLRRVCPDTAAKMEELLGGPSQRNDRRYPLAVGRIVNAFDQMSCEKVRRQIRIDAQCDF